jgi:hypothetical protein
MKGHPDPGRDERTLAALAAARRPLSVAELAEALSLPWDRVNLSLVKLLRAGKVSRSVRWEVRHTRRPEGGWAEVPRQVTLWEPRQ